MANKVNDEEQDDKVQRQAEGQECELSSFRCWNEWTNDVV